MPAELIEQEALDAVFPPDGAAEEAEDQELLDRIRAIREDKARSAVMDGLKAVGSGTGHPGVAPVIDPEFATMTVKWAAKLPKDVGIAVWDTVRNVAELSLDAGSAIADAQFQQLVPMAEAMGSQAAKEVGQAYREQKAADSTDGARALRDPHERQGMDVPPNLDDPTSIDLRDLAPEWIDAVDKVRAWAGQGDNAADVMTQKFFQFAGPFAATMKVLGGLSQAPGVATWLANAGKGGIADFLTSYAIFDPHEARFADLLHEFSLDNNRLVNAYVDYAMSDPAATDAEGRWKNAVDGALVGLPFAMGSAVFHSGRALARAVRGEVRPPLMSAGSPAGESGAIIRTDDPASPQAGPAAAAAGRETAAVGSVPDTGGRGVDRPSAEASALADAGIADKGVQGLRLTERQSDPDTAETFHDALQARYDADAAGKQITVLQPEELTSHRMFLADDGGAGFAISPSGEIVGLFKSPGSVRKGVAQEALRLAVGQGGTHLNAFDPVLPDIYSRAGFIEVARLKFNREFAPKGWDVAIMGEPDIVFMRYDPAAVGKPYQPGTRYVETYEEGLALARGEQP